MTFRTLRRRPQRGERGEPHPARATALLDRIEAVHPASDRAAMLHLCRDSGLTDEAVIAAVDARFAGAAPAAVPAPQVTAPGFATVASVVPSAPGTVVPVAPGARSLSRRWPRRSHRRRRPHSRPTRRSSACPGTRGARCRGGSIRSARRPGRPTAAPGRAAARRSRKGRRSRASRRPGSRVRRIPPCCARPRSCARRNGSRHSRHRARSGRRAPRRAAGGRPVTPARCARPTARGSCAANATASEHPGRAPLPLTSARCRSKPPACPPGR